MAGPSKKMRESDEEALQENEYSDISESEYSSDSKINVKISSSGEQSVSSDEAENVSDTSSMQPDIYANSGAQLPHFPFTGKPGINVYLEDPSNPLEYFELFCTPDIAEVIARVTNRYAQKFLENTPNLKLKSRTHRWKEMNRIEIMKLLAFFLLQGFHQKPNNKSYSSQKEILEMPMFLDLFSERFHLLLSFFHFVDNESYDEAICSSKSHCKLKPILDHLNAKFRGVYTPECDVSVNESLMMWKGRLSWELYIPSKQARFGIKPFKVCEAKSGYVWNFIIYTGQDTVFDESQKNEPYGSKIVLQVMAPLLNRGCRLEEQVSSLIHTSLELAKEIQFQLTQQ
jgi:hypothetical protein